jgi:precorrin-2 dehydrogenase
MSAALYPLFLNLQGRTCVVIGGNEMAEGKVRDLLDAGAKIRLISPDVTLQIADWSRAGRLHWEPRTYQRGDLTDAFLVVSISNSETNAQVFEESEARHVFCNAVDDTPHCSSYASQ